jgi:hypothetical protein
LQQAVHAGLPQQAKILFDGGSEIGKIPYKSKE